MTTTTTTTTQPDSLFEVWAPDEVAECLSVGKDLYAKIWNEIVPLYESQPRSEVPDDFASRALVRYWGRFTAEEQAALNTAAAEYGTL